MRSLLLAAALSFAAQALVSHGDSQPVQSEGFLRFPVRTTSIAPGTRIRSRQDAAHLTDQATGFLYSIDITVGTPGQKVTVNFDTGSSDLWVNPKCSTAPQGKEEMCLKSGQFTHSTTLIDLHQSSQLPYMIGSANVKWVQDYVTIGSSRLKQQIFGVASTSQDLTLGFMGVSPVPSVGWKSPYPLVIDQLASQGFIKSRAFSMDLRPINDDRGTVIFGGIDTKKFTGPLAKLPFIPANQAPDGATRYWVHVDGIAVTTADGKTGTVFDKPAGLAAFLDSGTTLSLLPTAMFNEFLKFFPGARKDPRYSQWYVDCALTKSNGFVAFKFGSVVINASFKDFIWQQPSSGVCALGFAPTDGDLYILGDTFLRSAYVVFDQDNQNGFVAQGADCGSNVIAIGKGPNAVPDLVGDCGKPSSTSSYTATVSTTGTARPTRTSSVTSTATGSTSAGWRNGTTTSGTTSTSTFTTTRAFTVTSCAPTVTNCPVGHVTTETATSITTWCPGGTEKDTVTRTASCPDVTGIFTIPAPICTKSACKHITQSTPAVITVQPVTTNPVIATVPCGHCTRLTTQGGTASGVSTRSTAPTQSTPVLAGAPRTFPFSTVGCIAAALAFALL